MTDSSLELPEDVGCAFCDYLSGRRPYTVLRRSRLTATLVTREQRGFGHVLVMPVAHRPTLLELVDAEAQELMIAIRDAAVAIDAVFERPGISVWQNNGVDANQRIGHLHFHVAGTLAEGGTEFGDVPELRVDETDAIADQLRGGPTA